MAVVFTTGVAVLSGWLPATAAASATLTPTPTVAASASPTPDVVFVDGAAVEFPLPATSSTQTLDVAGAAATLVTHTATDERGTTFNLGVIDYPDSVDLSDPAVNLLASVSGSAGNVGGRVLQQKVTTFRGQPAVTFRIETPAVRLAGRNVLVGRRMYAQNVAYRGLDDPPGAREFFDSFELSGSLETTS